MTQAKIMTFQISAAANATTTLPVTTQDDNQIRTVTGIWSTDATKLVLTGLQLQGKTIVSYDDFLNTLLKEPLECSVAFPAGVQINLVLQNGTAGAINNNDVLVRYEVAN